jgi:phosphatidate cytidylyltransferase
MRSDLLNLFAGVLAVLLFASLGGAVLKRRYAAERSNSAIDYLNARIKAWWWMTILLGLAFAFGKAGVVVLFGFLSFLCLREFVSLAYTRRGDHWVLALAFFFFLPLQYLLVGIEWYGLYAILIPVFAFLSLPILAVLSSDHTRFFERAAKIQAALMICVYCISYVPALVTLRIPGFEGGGLLLIAWLVLVVQTSDVLQYVWSRLFGRHAIAPYLSSAKTLEGAAGGVASAALLGAALSWLTPFTVLQAAGVAVLCTLMGSLGSLVIAAIKHDRGVRAWSPLVESQGGMLDRLDSVIFAAPVYFLSCRFGLQA